MEESSKLAIEHHNKISPIHLDFQPVDVTCMVCGKRIVMDLAYTSIAPPICDACNKIRDENRNKPKKTVRGIKRR